MAFINTNLRHVGTVGSGARCVLPGTTHGYVCGGWVGKTGAGHPWGPAVYGEMIEKFSLTSDGNATDVADILTSRRGPRGCSSATHGYVMGGHDFGASPGTQPGTHVNSIERFQFSNDSDSIDWADLNGTQRTYGSACSSETHGFSAGGDDNIAPYTTDTIDKYPFASQTNATDWANLTERLSGGSGCSSPTYGYTLGGTEQPGSVKVNKIQKFPFASQTDATDIADITLVRGGGAGVSSCTDAYCVGGSQNGTNPANNAPIWSSTVIDKFSFASEANATDHGDLIIESGAGNSSQAGVSGTTHGYVAGGTYFFNIHNHQYPREQIEKFAYANNVTVSDVGDLVDARSTGIIHWGQDNPSGHQV